MLSPAVPHQNAAAPTPHTRPASQAGIGASSSSPGAQPGISGPLGANSLNGGYLRNPPYHGNPSAPEWQAHRATHETWATVIGSIMQETPPGYSTVPFDQSCFYTLDLADPKPHNTAIHVRIQSESPGLSQSKMAVLQHSFGANGYQSLDLLPSPEGEPEYPREIRDHALKLMVGYVVDRFDTWTVGGSRSVDLRGSDIERATMRKMMEGQLAQRYQGDELKKRVALIKDVTDAPPAPQPASCLGRAAKQGTRFAAHTDSACARLTIRRSGKRRGRAESAAFFFRVLLPLIHHLQHVLHMSGDFDFAPEVVDAAFGID